MNKEKEFFSGATEIMQNMLQSMAELSDRVKLHPCCFHGILEDILQDVIASMKAQDKKFLEGLPQTTLKEYEDHVKNIDKGKVPVIFMGDK